MMYLSRIELNKQRTTTRYLLASPQRVHAAVKSCFAVNDERQLWRIDQLRNNLFLVLVSPSRPDFQCIKDQYGWQNQDYSKEILDYSKVFERLHNGQIFRFKLQANTSTPVLAKADQKERSQKRSQWRIFGEKTVRYQKEWLLKKSDKSGFSIVKVSDQPLSSSEKNVFEVSSGFQPKYYRSKKDASDPKESYSEYLFELKNRDILRFKHQPNLSSDPIVLYTATFQGLLQITDVECFKRTLINGIGRGKAYGCGLLTIGNTK
jgi:CRISPR system Cascade subunit CasE